MNELVPGCIPAFSVAACGDCACGDWKFLLQDFMSHDGTLQLTPSSTDS